MKNGTAVSEWEATYYVRDASGNILATYSGKVVEDPVTPDYTATLVLDEQHLYGSQRLGVVKKSVVLTRCMLSNAHINVPIWHSCATKQKSPPVSILRVLNRCMLSNAHINNAPMWHYYLAEHKPSPMSILRVEYQETFTGSMGADVFTYTITSKTSLTTASVDHEHTALDRGHTRFELSNHLGNVLAVISDRKLSIDNNTDGSTDHYEADVASAQDYYVEPMAKFRFIGTYGMQMPGRSYTNAVFASGEYRFGFQGQEGDDELYGEGNSTTAMFWQYDARLGRRWNVDPIYRAYESPYATFYNCPISFSDFLGLEGKRGPWPKTRKEALNSSLGAKVIWNFRQFFRGIGYYSIGWFINKNNLFSNSTYHWKRPKPVPLKRNKYVDVILTHKYTVDLIGTAEGRSISVITEGTHYIRKFIDINERNSVYARVRFAEFYRLNGIRVDKKMRRYRRMPGNAKIFYWAEATAAMKRNHNMGVDNDWVYYEGYEPDESTTTFVYKMDVKVESVKIRLKTHRSILGYIRWNKTLVMNGYSKKLRKRRVRKND